VNASPGHGARSARREAVEPNHNLQNERNRTMTTTTSPSNNGRLQRKSLSSQLDRLDNILDGLDGALTGAITDAVKDAVSTAIAEAVRATLIEVVSNPERRKRGHREFYSRIPASRWIIERCQPRPRSQPSSTRTATQKSWEANIALPRTRIADNSRRSFLFFHFSFFLPTNIPSSSGPVYTDNVQGNCFPQSPWRRA
jgi:hypothetical protein